MSLVTVQGSMKLAAAAAAAWHRLVADCKKQTGVTLTITSPAGAYRDEAMVVDMWRNPKKYGASQGVARPKSLGGPGSVHESGLCVDINNWAAVGSERLDALARVHGFRRTITTEPWHYQHSGVMPAAVKVDKFEEQGDIEMRVLYNKDSTDDATRRALIGELTFQVITGPQSTRERKFWGDPVNVTVGEWNAARDLVIARRKELGLPVAVTSDGSVGVDYDRIQGMIPTAEQNGAAARAAIVKADQ